MTSYPEIWVKPAEGRKVRLAGGGIVPADGMPVAKDHFISKLLLHGDLEEIKPPAGAVAAAKKASDETAAQSGGTEIAASKSTGN